MPNRQTDILFLSHRYNVTSGGEKALLDMIRYVVSIGLKPHVIIGSSGDITRYLDEMNVSHSIIYLPFWVHSGDDTSNFIFTSLNPTVSPTLQIVNLIKELQPRLCVTNTMVTPWLGYAASITGVHHAWMIHELGTDGFRFRYAIGEEQTLRNIDNLSDKIFYNSQFTANYYLPHFTVNKEAAIIYPAGESPQPERLSSPFKTKGIKLVCVGQVKQQKGQRDIIQAVHHLKNKGVDAELLLIGDLEDQEYPKELNQYVASHQLQDHVRFLGYQDNPASFMKHADIVINCATNESFGRVTVEGMLLKKPVIGADSAGTAEIIDSKKYGLLYKPGNYIQLANHIEHLSRSPKVMEAMGKAAYAIASKRYSAKTRYQPFVSYYKKLPEKTALNLQMLDATISDFQATTELLQNSQRELQHLQSGRLWRLRTFVHRIVRR